MERLKIIKELNNVANILEDNGRISEASQITNVLIKIAQTAPTGTGNSIPGNAGTGATGNSQFTPAQIKQNIKNHYNELLQLRTLAEKLRRKNPGMYTGVYTIDFDGYKIFTKDGTVVGKTLLDVAERTGEKVPALETGKDQILNNITENIASAANWPDPEGGPEITKAINEKYMLGYNLLGGTYYIGDKQNRSDVIDKKDINDLKTLFLSLGKYYKDTKTFPESIFEYSTGKKVDKDINVIILEALKEDFDNEMVSYIEKFDSHPNYKDIKRGFVQEYNRRKPKQEDRITEDIFRKGYYGNS